MEIVITLEEARQNHPELVKTLMDKLLASKLKDKNITPRDCRWYYSYGVAVRGMKFEDMINNIGKPEPEKSSQEIINEQLQAVIGLSLAVTVGKTNRYCTLEDKPRLFVEKFSQLASQNLDAKKREEDRLSKLTPDEKQREIQDNINELSKDPGFMGFNIGPGGIKKIEPEEIEYDLDAVLDKLGRVGGLDGLTAGERKFLEEQSK